MKQDDNDLKENEPDKDHKPVAQEAPDKSADLQSENNQEEVLSDEEMENERKIHEAQTERD